MAQERESAGGFLERTAMPGEESARVAVSLPGDAVLEAMPAPWGEVYGAAYH